MKAIKTLVAVAVTLLATAALAAATPGVLAVSPVVSGPAFAARGNSNKSVVLLGVEPEQYRRVVRMDDYMTRGRFDVLQWLMFQMGGVGPMFGQLGFFHKFAGKDWEDKRPRDRYVAESRRLLKVLEQHLAGRAWMLGGDYSIADIAIWPWVNNLVGFYGAGELVGFAEFADVKRVLDAFLARPAVQRGLKIPLRT